MIEFPSTPKDYVASSYRYLRLGMVILVVTLGVSIVIERARPTVRLRFSRTYQSSASRPSADTGTLATQPFAALPAFRTSSDARSGAA